MISIIFLILIGLFFYDFVRAHNKSAWGWALGGVIFYYVGVFTISIVIGLAAEAMVPNSLITWPFWVFTLIEIASGLLSNWILYRMLKKKWARESSDDDMDGFLDAGL